jgi:Spy/CpxP family protein refolding chaperone
MGRHIGWALAVLLAVGGALTTAEAGSQQQQQPAKADHKGESGSSGHRMAWWKDEKAKAEIGLTAEQASKIDRIFQDAIEKAKPLREEVNQLEKELSQTMKATTAEVSVVAQQVETVENKRAQLNKLRVIMLYKMRRVLTPEQNVRFQAYMDRREAERKKQDADRRK